MASGSTPERWATTPIARRTRSGSRSTSSPATRADPESGLVSVVRIFTAVDLPAPLGPSRAKIVPLRTSRLRPSSARTSPGYVLTRSAAWIASGMSLAKIATEDLMLGAGGYSATRTGASPQSCSSR